MIKSPRFTRLQVADRRTALIKAALTCMADGGITAFTVDRVCTKAQVSRGLITHHFGGMGGLLTAACINIYTQAIPNAAYLPIGRGPYQPSSTPSLTPRSSTDPR